MSVAATVFLGVVLGFVAPRVRLDSVLEGGLGDSEVSSWMGPWGRLSPPR